MMNLADIRRELLMANVEHLTVTNQPPSAGDAPALFRLAEMVAGLGERSTTEEIRPACFQNQRFTGCG